MINVLLANFALCMSLCWFCISLLARKNPLYVIEVVCFLYFVGTSFSGSMLMRILLVIIGILLYVQIQYVGKKGYKLFISIVYIACIVISEIFCASLLHGMWNVGMYDVYTLPYTFVLLMAYFLVFVLLFVVGQYIDGHRRQCVCKGAWMLLVLPIATVILLLNVKDYFLVFQNEGLFIIGMFGIVCANGVVLYQYRQIQQVYALSKKLEQEQQDYMILENLYVSCTKVLHDLTHGLYRLKGVSDMSLRSEVDSLCLVAMKQYYSKNAMLNKYHHLFSEYGICASMDLSCTIDTYVLEKIIEYAIQECICVVGKRELVIQSYKIDEKKVLRFVCTTNGSVCAETIKEMIDEEVVVLVNSQDKKSEITIVFVKEVLV